MGNRYNHLSVEERNDIQTGLNLGLSRHALAFGVVKLGYHASLSRADLAVEETCKKTRVFPFASEFEQRGKRRDQTRT
jgi:hypothetical protein